MNNFDENYEKLAQMVRDIKFVMLTTLKPDGSLHSRPMISLQLDPKKFTGSLWFFSQKNSLKNHEIENDQHVNLAYSDTNKHHYISISGRAFISDDKTMMENLWTDDLKTWFPKGLSDQNISLLKIQVEAAEIWDSPPGKVIQILNFAKTKLTGRATRPSTERPEIRH